MRRNELGCSGAGVLGAHCDCASATRAQLAAVTKERDEMEAALGGAMDAIDSIVDSENAIKDALKADLAREREQAQSLARQLLVEQERRAKLEAALELTAENQQATADEYCRRAGYKLGIVFIAEKMLGAIRARAGLDAKEGG